MINIKDSFIIPARQNIASQRIRGFDWFDFTNTPYSIHEIGDIGISRSNFTRTYKDFFLRRKNEVSLIEKVKNRNIFVCREIKTGIAKGRLERLVFKSAKHSVYDFDDAIMLLKNKISFGSYYSWLNSVQMADIVIAGNDLLAEYASKYNKNTVIIPTVVNPKIYMEKTNYEYEDKFKVVWIGSGSTEKYLLNIKEQIIKATKYGVSFEIISVHKSKSQLGNLENYINRKIWTMDTFPKYLQSADMGIMPLINSPWEQGKCGYKLLQYAASGLPMAGSSVGTNKKILREIGGIPVKNDNEWLDAILDLKNSSSNERRKMGVHSLKKVKELYSFDSWKHMWLSTIKP